MNAIIQLNHVSKRFVLQHQRSRSFQELVINLLRGRKNTQQETFWVLQDVNFEVAPGETVGLIGPNGAGKSSVLKLISRIIQPTSGQIYIKGRVGALLELGTGFHPDLTGRENIYLNGAILGLSRTQIRQKLDDIIDFAELERFIDLPVKHYSSGMYVRLGFSVAVHTEPEVLLVDEVLAVGDATFQRKCMTRIYQLQQAGGTILLVSHDLDTMQKVCRRAIWMNKGEILADGDIKTVVVQYLRHSYAENPVTVSREVERQWGSGEVRIEQVRFINRQGQEQDVFATGELLIIEMRYQASQRVERPVFGIAIHRNDGMHVTGPNTQFAGYEIPWIEGEGIIQYTIPSLSLLDGTYYVTVAVCDWEDTQMFDYHDRLYPFRVIPAVAERYGVVTLKGDWSWNGEVNKAQPEPVVKSYLQPDAEQRR